jgi:WD40 repeat protein
MMMNHVVGNAFAAQHNVDKLSPSRTVVTSFNPKKSSTLNDSDYFDEGDWVLCVATNEERQKVGCALSNGEVQIYDQNTLQHLHTYQRNSSLVTEMTFDTFDANILAATANDGSLTLYDIRQPINPAIEITNTLRPDEEALCISMGFDGKIAAVGSSKGKIHFYDIREKRGILGTYSQAHTNEVTRVRFQSFAATQSSDSICTSKYATPILVSGSEDGLACVFDTSKTTEESAITNILTVQSPIREVGFFGPNSEAIYCLTGSESLQLYHKDDANCRKDFGHTREYLNNQLVRYGQNVATTSASSSSVCPIEYLVDCHWDFARQELLMLAGSSKGDGAVFKVDEQNILPLHCLRGGHRGVVRAWSYNSNRSSFFTVGEDARMCEWGRFSSKISVDGNGNGNGNGNQIIITRKRQGCPVARGGGGGGGGGKLRKPRSRMAATPY